MNGLFEILKKPKTFRSSGFTFKYKRNTGSSLKDILGANISEEYLMTYHESLLGEENINKDKEIIINGKKHQWYFNNETINTTKIKKIVRKKRDIKRNKDHEAVIQPHHQKNISYSL